MPATSPEAIARKYARKNAKRAAATAAARTFAGLPPSRQRPYVDPAADRDVVCYEKHVCRSWRSR